jgi:hypothetical protein
MLPRLYRLQLVSRGCASPASRQTQNQTPTLMPTHPPQRGAAPTGPGRRAAGPSEAARDHTPAQPHAATPRRGAERAHSPRPTQATERHPPQQRLRRHNPRCDPDGRATSVPAPQRAAPPLNRQGHTSLRSARSHPNPAARRYQSVPTGLPRPSSGPRIHTIGHTHQMMRENWARVRSACA